MELGPGGDLLERFLAEGRIMTEARVCRKIAVPLLVSLKALHDLHIIHRYVTCFRDAIPPQNRCCVQEALCDLYAKSS